MYKIGVLISGGGSNLQAIMDAIESGELNCSIEAVISDRDNAYGIERARSKNINTYVLNRKAYGEELSNEIYKILDDKVDLVVLAGFLSILNNKFISKYKNRIINIHPSLIPSFCGKGMYGLKVHEKAIEYGVKVSGCTVHFVDEGTDTGAIILQKAVQVLDDDTAESLQKRILEKEHESIVKAVKYLSEDKVTLDGRKVIIRG